jgi:MoaA/NifB/PqqE/SkfB family radical SAM enzyme
MIKLSGFKKFTIELTTLCNLKCKGCPRTVGINSGSWTNKSMPIDIFQSCLGNLPKIGMVTLHGIGEPTLHPNFLEILSLAKRSKKFGKIKITSNGLAKPIDFYVESFNKGLDEVWFSVDSVNQTLSNHLRENTDIRKLESLITSLHHAGISPMISMTISSENYRDALYSAHVLLGLGAEQINMQEFQDFGNVEGVLSNYQRGEFIQRSVEHARRFPLDKISYPPFVVNALGRKEPDPKMMCSAPWERPAMNVDGYLTPCCTTFDPAIWGYSSLADRRWDELYNSLSVRKWISAYMQSRGSIICQGCAIDPKNQYSDVSLGSRSHQAPPRAT